MTADAKTEAERTPPQQQRPKMGLDEQAAFLTEILRRCKLHSEDMRGRFAGEATLTLTTDDMLRLETIQQTLTIFDQHNAAKLVKEAIWRGARGRR